MEECRKIVPAGLPAGWVWENFADGSGALVSPDGKRFFGYDIVPYYCVGGIEYEEDAHRWNVFNGTLHEFRVFAEDEIRDRLGL